MTSLVRCFCGNSIGDIYGAFVAERHRLIAESVPADVAPEYFETLNMKVTMGDVLDDLGLEHECCRARMIAQVTMADINEV